MKSDTIDKLLIVGAGLLGVGALAYAAGPVIRKAEGAVKNATNAAFGHRPTTDAPKSTGAKPSHGAPTAPVPNEQQAAAPETVPTDPASVAARAAGAAAYAQQGGSAYTDTATAPSQTAQDYAATYAQQGGDAFSSSVGG